jgi:diguanylate cyclase
MPKIWASSFLLLALRSGDGRHTDLSMTFKFSSLRTALLLPFVGLVIAVATAIGGLSYITGVRAVEDFSEQMLRDVTHRITQTTMQHLNTPKIALNAVAPDASSVLPGATGSIGELAPPTFDAFERRLWLATALFPDVSGYIYYGTDDGRFVGVNRSAAGTELRIKDSVDKQRVAYRSSGPNMRGDELRRDTFDPRSRPWYQAAVKANGLAWSPIYVAATSQALTLTLAKPVFDGNNKLQGVVATDIPLGSLERFVQSLRASETGVAFIVDSDGALVATSTGDRLIKQENGKPIRINATQSDNALIRQSYAAFARKQTSASAGSNADISIRTSFESENGSVDLAATPQTDSAGLNWTMLVAIPRTDHMGNLRKTVFQNIAIGLLAVAMAIAIGLWFSQRIAADVTRLSDATRLLASGLSPASLNIDRNDEIGSIAKSMVQMSAGLLTDPLTGALNRATFEKRFNAQIGESTNRIGTLGALVFIDLDGFKKINDAHGHTVGDALLAVTAQRLASVLRRSDLLGRFGGDEFLLLLSNVSAQNEVDATINRCREQLEQPVIVAGQTLRVGASFGSALFPDDGRTLDRLIAAADRKMYREKSDGVAGA